MPRRVPRTPQARLDPVPLVLLMSRELRLLPVSAGLDALPALEQALGGQGPALLPVPAGEPEVARRVADALGAGEGLDEAPDTALVIATSGSKIGRASCRERG